MKAAQVLGVLGHIFKYPPVLFVWVGKRPSNEVPAARRRFLRLQKKNDAPWLACSIALSWNLREALLFRPTGPRFPVGVPKTASTHTCSLGTVT